jgi:type IV secretory pathway protease TraF
LPAGALLIKRVAAHTGDLVCRFGTGVTINGRRIASARTRDARGRAMPRWSGCSRIEAGYLFLIADRPLSFDSRYFGKIAPCQVLGTALGIWQAAAPRGLRAGAAIAH